MYTYNQIRTVQLAITDKCDAACPQCGRNDFGGKVNPRLPLVSISLAEVQGIFSPRFISQLDTMIVCGNYGDPIMGKETLEIFRYFRDCNDKIFLSMFTNGGVRPEEWWVKLAQIFTKKRGSVTFAIDGLEDTNPIYRRNTQWPVLMRNVQAFIRAGGNAQWDFLVFRHNEHQVEEARTLSNELGFSQFNLKKTRRFIDVETMEYRDRTPIKNNDGETIDWLEMPENPKLRNENLGQFPDQNNTKLEYMKSHYPSFRDYLDTTIISCGAQADKAIYITATGYVVPCCYLATHFYNDNLTEEQRQILPILEEMGGWDMINVKKRNLKEIIEGPFFQHHIPESWKKETFSQGKNHTCALICGKTSGSKWERFKSKFLTRNELKNVKTRIFSE